MNGKLDCLVDSVEFKQLEKTESHTLLTFIRLHSVHGYYDLLCQCLLIAESLF